MDIKDANMAFHATLNLLEKAVSTIETRASSLVRSCPLGNR